MTKRLGSAGTGDIISQNFESFKFDFDKKAGDFYYFTWKFNRQFGFISIKVKNDKISNTSLIATGEKCLYPFRPLGLYNDNSLQNVFDELLRSIEVYTNGIYSENFIN